MTAPLSSRGALGWLSAALGGGLSAAAFAFALAHAETVLIFLAYLAALPLFVVGLGAGSVSGLLATLLASLGLFLGSSPNVAIIYVLLNAVPVAILALMALRYRQGEDQLVYWYPEGYLLTALAFYPCILFLMAVGLTLDHEGGLLALSLEVINNATAQLATGMEQAAADNFKNAMGVIVPVMPALVGCSWIFLMIISAMGAQSILRQQNWLLRAPLRLENVILPNWLILAVAAAGLVGYFSPAPYDYIGTNICILLCIPFFFVGLSVIHAYAATKKARLLILIAFYVLMTFFAWIAILVTVVGALDQNMNFRQRLTNKLPKSN